MTRQRRVILEELKGVDSHPTADEVYELVRKRLPYVSLGTVYRNLELLAESGLIQKLEVGGTRRRFDGDPGNHYHVRCLGCGDVRDVSVESNSTIHASVQDASGYEIVGHRLEFIGVCPQCRQEGRSTQGDKED